MARTTTRTRAKSTPSVKYASARSSLINTRHGHARKGKRSRAYRAWCSMHARAGEISIGVAARWRAFEAFLLDLGEPPVGHQLRRIDSNKPYKPSNCEWATRETIMSNRPGVRWVTFKKQTMSVAAAARAAGMPRVNTLRVILNKLNTSDVAKALKVYQANKRKQAKRPA